MKIDDFLFRDDAVEALNKIKVAVDTCAAMNVLTGVGIAKMKIDNGFYYYRKLIPDGFTIIQNGKIIQRDDIAVGDLFITRL